MSHTAKALVLHCMDFRFAAGLRQYLVEQGLDGQYDIVCAAGAAKNIVDPKSPGDKDFILWHVGIAKQLHGITEVHIINHLDCGAYGKIFTTPEAERERHVADLQKAQAAVLEAHPGLTVRLGLASLQNGDVTVENV